MLRTLLLSTATLGLILGGSAMATEEPAFDLVGKFDHIEIRQYRPLIVAETVVEGDMGTATNGGFRLLADYIFGNTFGKNASNRGEAEKIAMTAPVTMEPASERIAMTAPVTMEPASVGNSENWRIHFVMPSAYRLADLPKPLDPLVSLREVGAHRVAAVTFSGWTTRASIAENTARLQAWMAKQGLAPAGKPQVARYNDPFTLPWNRRNEILIEVAP